MDKEILISEHSSLREEIIGLTNEMSTLQKIALYLSGSLWAWFSTQNIPLELLFILYLPAGLSALIFLRARVIFSLIGKMDNYLIKMKETVKLPKELGWEKYLKGIPWWKKPNYFWNALYWGGLILGNWFLAKKMIRLLE